MVEMNETASILHNLSHRSLILLDEIGRGTSTYDGISIAWAMVEYIHEHPTAKAKTLFATHYHELNEMEERFHRVRNYNVSVKEDGKQVIFLRKLQPGGVAHSFGIHVARMAGMPAAVLSEAERMLLKLESQRSGSIGGSGKKRPETSGLQMSFFQMDDPVLIKIREELDKLKIENLTPLEAFDKLREFQKLLRL
jgi:DNA mismatch repair protein MutS